MRTLAFCCLCPCLVLTPAEQRAALRARKDEEDARLRAQHAQKAQFLASQKENARAKLAQAERLRLEAAAVLGEEVDTGGGGTFSVGEALAERAALECPVCLEAFDRAEHWPRLLLGCGHTTCESCIDAMLGAITGIRARTGAKKVLQGLLLLLIP